MSLWKLRCGTEIDVPLSRYDGDFVTAVQQIRELAGLRTSRSYVLHVRVRPYAAFKAWAKAQTPDWERYTWSAVKHMHAAGLVTSAVRDNYDAPSNTARLNEAVRRLRRRGCRDVGELGFDLFVESLARAIKSGVDLPPLVMLNGRPMDGRHRTLGAIRLHLECAPVAEVGT